MNAFLTEAVEIEQHPGIDLELQIQLYTASFWGVLDVVRAALNAGANVNVKNLKTGWTPLHAAAFQEHGPCVMELLEAGASPDACDAGQITPIDFASISDKVWPHFGSRGCQRVSRAALVERGLVVRMENDNKTPARVIGGLNFGINSLQISSQVSRGSNSNRSITRGGTEGDILGS